MKRDLRITRLDTYCLTLPKEKPILIATGAISSVKVVLLRVSLSDGSHGWGEACPYPMITGETQAGIMTLAAECAPVWIGRDAFAIEARMAELDRVVAGNPTLKSMFDLALHDAVSRSMRQPLWQWLGAAGPRPIQSDMTAYLDTPEVMAAAARGFVASGFRVIKIKLGEDMETDLARTRAVRAAIGGEVTLRIDANQGWDTPTALAMLKLLAPLDIEHCEQPVARWNLAGMRQLTAASPIPIMADESLFDEHDAVTLVAEKACHLFNLKFSKSSGIHRARKILAVASAAAVPVQAGCMGETRLGLTALLHLCYAAPGIRYYDMDGCAGHGADPVQGGMMFGRDGTLTLTDANAPGLGVEIDPGFLSTLPTQTFA